MVAEAQERVDLLEADLLERDPVDPLSQVGLLEADRVVLVEVPAVVVPEDRAVDSVRVAPVVPAVAVDRTGRGVPIPWRSATGGGIRAHSTWLARSSAWTIRCGMRGRFR